MYLSIYVILYFVALHEYVGIDDPHAFINVFYTWFCRNTQVRGDRRSPRIYQHFLLFILLHYTNLWGSTMPAYLSMYLILYFDTLRKVRGDRRSPLIYQYLLLFILLHNTSSCRSWQGREKQGKLSTMAVYVERKCDTCKRCMGIDDPHLRRNQWCEINLLSLGYDETRDVSLKYVWILYSKY